MDHSHLLKYSSWVNTTFALLRLKTKRSTQCSFHFISLLLVRIDNVKCKFPKNIVLYGDEQMRPMNYCPVRVIPLLLHIAIIASASSHFDIHLQWIKFKAYSRNTQWNTVLPPLNLIYFLLPRSLSFSLYLSTLFFVFVQCRSVGRLVGRIWVFSMPSPLSPTHNINISLLLEQVLMRAPNEYFLIFLWTPFRSISSLPYFLPLPLSHSRWVFFCPKILLFSPPCACLLLFRFGCLVAISTYL